MSATPLNFNLIIPDISTKTSTPAVTTTSTFIAATDTFHPEGLFSNEIFGIQGTEERIKTFAHIRLNTNIIHPRIYKNLIQAVHMYEDIMHSRVYAIWDKKTKDFVKSDIDNGETGYEFFVSHINELVVPPSGSLKRDTLIALMKKYKNRLIYYIPVMPAGLRDYTVSADGKPSQDEVNDYYASILSYSSLLPKNNANKLSDNTRLNLQKKIVELARYLLDDTLYGFINKRWVNRRIFGGTRNVITAYKPPSADMDSPTRAKLTDTLIGIYQISKQMQETVTHLVQKNILDQIFVGDQLFVVNKKTLERVTYEFDHVFYDSVYNNDGMVKFTTALSYDRSRDMVLEYEDNYLFLVYENYDDHEYAVLFDIHDLPEGKDRKYVRPATLVDMFFFATIDTLHLSPHVSTRHPVMDNGGTYAGLNYLKVTNELTVMKNVIHGKTISNYPVWKSGYFTSMSPNPARLGPLAGDNDGDMVSNLSVSTEESKEEIRDKLKEARYYISSDGGFHYSTTAGALPLILSSITA